MIIEVHVELRAIDTINAVRRGDVIAIVDVLRCSSTIITALVNGASEIIPVSTVRKARQIKQEHPNYLLAGERKGFKLKSFDLGNSPKEFNQGRVCGRGIILTTTDGTKAFEIAKNAKHVLVGGFLNAEAVGKRIHEIAFKYECGVSLIACGKKGKLSLEDFICAGKILDTMPANEFTFSDSARAALLAFKGAGDKTLELVRSCEHGKYLKKIGLMEDIRFCLRTDFSNEVPVLFEDRITCLKREDLK